MDAAFRKKGRKPHLIIGGRKGKRAAKRPSKPKAA